MKNYFKALETGTGYAMYSFGQINLPHSIHKAGAVAVYSSGNTDRWEGHKCQFWLSLSISTFRQESDSEVIFQ